MAKDGIKVHIYGDYNNKDIDKAIRDLKSLKTDAGNTEQQFGKMSKGMKIAGAAIAAAVAGMGVAVTKFAADSIGAASDLEESQSKVTQVFGDQADQVLAWAKTSSVAFGQSQQQALEAAGTYGNLLRAFGLSTDAAREMSVQMVELAADLASFNNTSIDDAIQAIRSGLSGETEPLKRFGVALTDARLKAEALAAGIYEGSGALDAGQKAQAAYALILKDTTLAQGDFARTADGLANTQRIVEAAVEDAKAAIGTGLVDAMGEAIDAMGGAQGLVSTIDDAADVFANFTEGVGDLARELSDLRPEINTTRSRLGEMADVLQSEFGWSALFDLPGAIADNISAFRSLVDPTYRAANVQAALNEVIEQNIDYADPFARGMHAAARAADDMASSSADAAIAGEAAARSLLEVAIATGQVPSAARFAQRFDVAAMLDNIGKAAKITGSSARSASSSVDKLSDRIESARDRAKTAIADMRNKLRDELLASRQEFNDYADSVSQSIRGAINFSDAAPEFDEQGNRVGMTFMEALQAQASKAQEFATKVKTLIAMNLSEDALNQVLAAGVNAGTRIADELITGGATTIEQTNELVRTSKEAADEVGLQAAQSYYGAGVKTAQDTYEGFKANFGKGGPARKALMGVMDNLARAAARDVRIDVAVTRSINEVVTRVVQTINAPYAGERAMGGPVKAGSAYLIGERGPELFVPDISGTVVSNNDMRSSGGVAVGSGVTLNVYAGMGTDGAEVGRQIVDALKAYERRNGAVYASA